MSLTINTNLSSMIVQNNLAKSTSQLNNAIERMTTGYKINHASDNAAGYSIARNWEAKLGSLDVAADNAATGADMLATLEDNYALISNHLQRVRDLTEQAANGTYGAASKDAIESEITARLQEIDRIAANCEFNGINLMAGGNTDGTPGKDGLDIQVGTEGSVMGIFNIFIAGPQVFVCTLVSWFINKCSFNVFDGVNYHWEYTFIIGAICLIAASFIASKVKDKTEKIAQV